MKNLIKRALTGFVFVVLIVGSICFHSMAFLAGFSLITALVLWEFYGLVKHYEGKSLKRIVHTLGGVYLFATSFLFANDLADGRVFLPYVLFLVGVLIAELYHKEDDPIGNWSIAFLGQFYCAGSFSLLNFISAVPGYPGEIIYTPLFVLAIFVFIWTNDTGAYLVGSLIGKHRLFERISPKKSWEGFWGGFIITAACSQIFAWYAPHISWSVWLGFSIIVVVFGTWGDLIESLMKRTLAVKDSGHVLPGHGGLLDRFDSALLAIPAAYIYIQLFIQN